MKHLNLIHTDIQACRACPNVVGPPVHGAAIHSPVYLLGQAPGPREGHYGKPFAYTAGRTLFHWFEEVSGVEEARFRERIYMAAVARCYPGKGKSSGDRIPDKFEIAQCSAHIQAELSALEPKLILAVGKLAIAQVLGEKRFHSGSKLVDVIGTLHQAEFHGRKLDVICLPHPSGLSAWHKIEPGKTLLQKSLKLIVKHTAWQEAVE